MNILQYIQISAHMITVARPLIMKLQKNRQTYLPLSLSKLQTTNSENLTHQQDVNLQLEFYRECSFNQNVENIHFRHISTPTQ